MLSGSFRDLLPGRHAAGEHDFVDTRVDKAAPVEPSPVITVSNPSGN